MRTPVSTRVWRFTRAGAASPDPANVVRRAQSFAVAASESGTVTLVCVRDGRGMAGYLVTDDGSSADQAALHLAQTVAARAEPVAELPDLDGVGSVGWLRAHPTSVASRDVQAGADPSEVSRRLAVAMRPGQWVAIVLRPARRHERQRVLRWYAHRLGTANPVHHITDEQAVVASIVAGGADADEVRSLLRQLAAALPGFDVDTKVSTSTRWRDVAALDAVSIGSWLGVGIGLNVWMVASLVGSIPAALAFGIAYGLVPTRAGKVAKAVSTGRFGAPSKRLLPPRRPREEKAGKDNGRKGTAPANGSYPLAATTFLLSPSVVVGLVAPHAGGASGASTTERRAAPEMLLDPRIGPALGQAGDDPAMVHLPAGDFPSGVAIVGKQGSGKAQPLDTWFPVPASVRFPSGWARNEELEVGDSVFACDGEATEVVGFSEVFDGNCFEVSLDDGQKVRCDSGHLWSVSTAGMRADGHPEVIVATEEMATAMSRRRRPGYAIALSAPIVGPETSLAYPASQIGAGVHCCRAGADATVAPEVLRASIDQRRAVLAGLMDTEGGIGTNGRCALVFCRADTAASVVELVRSLGIKVVVHERTDDEEHRRWHVRFVTNTAVSALRETIKARLGRAPEDADTERAALARLGELTEAAVAEPSAKYTRLVEHLKAIGVGPRSKDRAVVFAERVATLEWLRDSLPASLGIPKAAVRVMHGGLSDDEQQQLVEDFKQADAPVRVLVTGDVASEGVNLHRQCHELVHFDIPWSLIRIEQRNGRIDRYGQKHSPRITSLLLEPDHPKFGGDLRVLTRLMERENEAHTALGDVASLMGKYDGKAEEDEIRKVLAGTKDFDDAVSTVEKASTSGGLGGLFARTFGAAKSADETRPATATPMAVEAGTGLYTGDVVACPALPSDRAWAAHSDGYGPMACSGSNYPMPNGIGTRMEIAPARRTTSTGRWILWWRVRLCHQVGRGVRAGVAIAPLRAVGTIIQCVNRPSRLCSALAPSSIQRPLGESGWWWSRVIGRIAA